MKITKKITLTPFAILALCSASAVAENEENNDPSNVSKPTTSLTIGATNKGDVKLFGSAAFDVNDTQKSMFLLEGDMDGEGDYKSARMQYFHAFSTGNAMMPIVAASLDFVDNDMMSSLSVGSVLAVTPTENFAMYLRAGVLVGEYKDDSDALALGGFTIDDDSFKGAMAAAWFTYKTGSDGTYLTFHPEYTYIDGDVEIETLKTSYRVGTPLNESQTHWGEFRIDHTSTTMEGNNNKMDIDDTSAWFMYKAYF